MALVSGKDASSEQRLHGEQHLAVRARPSASCLELGQDLMRGARLNTRLRKHCEFASAETSREL